MNTTTQLDPDFQLESYAWLQENCGEEFVAWLGSAIEMHGPEQAVEMLAAAVEYLSRHGPLVCKTSEQPE